MSVFASKLLAPRIERTFSQHVVNVHRPAFENRAAGDGVTIDRNRLDAGNGFRQRPLRCEMTEHVAVSQVHRCRSRVAEARRAVGDRIERRLHVGGRARYHAKDLRHRRLLLQGLLGLVEQTHVFDRDRRLVGESLDQCDLLVGEKASFHSPKLDGSDRAVFSHQRHGERRVMSDALLQLAAHRKFVFRR